eukprot:CAMPEP_0181306952 /NCGR_PEP_ID=MMETSP1101-20121128/10591_1 /TAXON_ID=46948 /ORGANISM="Rhodomonas abbreviata, Strain Caron Lab Isolate" /LENGTH=349 /DNA_ID=CAMNT_0023413077 /DNA_START=232 /DNA_END=1281 /DNA_ORIENTATION=-
MTAVPGDSAKPVVVVAGATGRVGRQVVEFLLNPPSTLPQIPVTVRALVRDVKKAEDILPTSSLDLQLVACDLTVPAQIKSACNGATAAVWCATGFSDNSQRSVVDKLVGAFRLKFTPQEVVDITGMRALGESFKGSSSELGGPSVVLCSSAGVTRPTWSEEKKKRLEGAADIPIVRLNPLGILDVKRECEETLRSTGASYSVVRPCGLNDKWPAGRPVFSQGDLAVGRINRADVASVLATLLFEASATGRTFETFSMSGYPAPRSFAVQLERLQTDQALESISETEREAVAAAQYSLLQQLVPGETMAPNQLAMGQTYEQLDKGEQGRFGERGTELPPIVRSDSSVVSK